MGDSRLAHSPTNQASYLALPRCQAEMLSQVLPAFIAENLRQEPSAVLFSPVNRQVAIPRLNQQRASHATDLSPEPSAALRGI